MVSEDPISNTEAEAYGKVEVSQEEERDKNFWQKEEF